MMEKSDRNHLQADGDGLSEGEKYVMKELTLPY